MRESGIRLFPLFYSLFPLPASQHLRIYGIPEREINRRPLIGLALRPHAPAVAIDYAADDGEADAGALKLAHIVQALERNKQFVDVGHVESGAVVAHEVDGMIVLVDDAELDVRLRLL